MGKSLEFTSCPKCILGTLHAVGEHTGGFSAGKAAIGAVIAGPIGLVAGALGKKKITYQCDRCGYTVEGGGTFSGTGHTGRVDPELSQLIDERDNILKGAELRAIFERKESIYRFDLFYRDAEQNLKELYTLYQNICTGAVSLSEEQNVQIEFGRVQPLREFKRELHIYFSMLKLLSDGNVHEREELTRIMEQQGWIDREMLFGREDNRRVRIEERKPEQVLAQGYIDYVIRKNEMLLDMCPSYKDVVGSEEELAKMQTLVDRGEFQLPSNYKTIQSWLHSRKNGARLHLVMTVNEYNDGTKLGGIGSMDNIKTIYFRMDTWMVGVVRELLSDVE